MRSLRLCTDGLGQSKLESLPLPFMFVGPTATEADKARAPRPELATACRSVETLRRHDGDHESRSGDGSARRLLLVVSGALEVETPDMRARLGPGDVLFFDDAPGDHTITYHGECRVVRLDVDDSWVPEGVVAPTLDESRREEADPPLVRNMYVKDDQARFREFDELFDDPRARPVARVSFLGLSPDSFGDWHTEAATSLVVVLAGGFELEVGGDGGAVEVFGPGDVCLVQDQDGQGHRTRTHGETRFAAIVVPEEHVWG